MSKAMLYQQILTSQTALDAAGSVRADLLPNTKDVGFYVQFGAGTSAGQVVIEAAHDPSYTGTWAELASVDWAAANKEHYVSVHGVFIALRARISTAIVGGTANVWAIGN
jgi:hypothetical protein